MNPTGTESGHRLGGVLERVRGTRVVENRGRVVQLIGLVIESEGPLCAVGELCRIEGGRNIGDSVAEVVGFRQGRVLLMPLGETQGIHPGAEVVALGHPLEIPVGPDLLGRVLNGLGEPIDGLPPVKPVFRAPCMAAPPHPL